MIWRLIVHRLRLIDYPWFILETCSLVKLHYFQFAFLENCAYKKQKKSIKDQRIFCSNAFFKVFTNFVSGHSKIWCLRFFFEQNDINLFIPLARLAIFLKLKNVYIWQLQWSAIHSKYKFCFLSQSSKSVNLLYGN